MFSSEYSFINLTANANGGIAGFVDFDWGASLCPKGNCTDPSESAGQQGQVGCEGARLEIGVRGQGTVFPVLVVVSPVVGHDGVTQASTVWCYCTRTSFLPDPGRR